MDINAYKMDGLGNDFVIIDNRLNLTTLNKDQIVKICNRKFIGCDQLILINNHKTSDAYLEFFNSDGSNSGACGNGTRCIAEFISRENKKKKILLSTSAGELYSDILGDNIVETKIGIGRTNWNQIPLSHDLDTKNLGIKITDINGDEHLGGIAINVGNPHVIFFVSNLDKFDIQKIGKKIEQHKFFPEKCNVTIAQIITKNLIKVRVWERGAGLTKACGSAACATAFAGFDNQLTLNQVNIEFKTGNLSIKIDKDNFIKMKGPVSNIEKIQIKL